MSQVLVQAYDSELIIGFVAAAGTQVDRFRNLLQEQLALAGYKTCLIKVSKDVIPDLSPVPSPDAGAFERINGLMDAGNDSRARTKEKAILAVGAASKIRERREKDANNDSLLPLERTASIVDSLKRPEEVAMLRQVYPSGFVLVGIHESKSRRKSHLQAKGMTPEQADTLIERDSGESKVPYGQRVNETFHLADFFVRIDDSHDRLTADTKRMVNLWFGHPYITPTFDEHAMFLAFTAGLRSADLSRQVGAVVARGRQVLSMGANDCPQARGGLYWPERSSSGEYEDVERGRDYKRGCDSNRHEQNRIIDAIVRDAEQSLPGSARDLQAVLGRSTIGDLTEFGRVVHAEMEALLACGREGISTRDATLFCTTFPCHNCAKHIVAAGLKRVVFIEPYPKSKALEFHDDSIFEGEDGDAENPDGKVVFEPFVGVGPRRFFDSFSLRLTSSYEVVRKIRETGEAVPWDIKNARLRIQMSPISYLDLEKQADSVYAKASDALKGGQA